MNSIAQEQLKLIDDVVTETLEKKEQIDELVQHYEKRIIDIEHVIEFGVFNVVEGYKLADELRKAKQMRRHYRHESDILYRVVKRFDEKSLESTHKSVDDKESHIENAKYTFRVLTPEENYDIIKLAKLMN